MIDGTWRRGSAGLGATGVQGALVRAWCALAPGVAA